MTSSIVSPAPAFTGKLRFLAISAAAALTAASAAHVTTLIAVPAWAMFMGWVAYYTRGHSGRDGLVNYACLALGIALGLIAVMALGALAPTFGAFALPSVVLVVATLVVSLRAMPVLSNIPAYFLGLVTVFASHAQPTLAALAELGLAGAIGSFAAWFASGWQQRLASR
ncbi:MAG: DUF1097 domain-containing protein [Sphingopyxis sp.]|nr:DUF1097 domain-containing protein [Sphingopyxis sp.]